MCLEFSHVEHPILKTIYDTVSLRLRLDSLNQKALYAHTCDDMTRSILSTSSQAWDSYWQMTEHRIRYGAS